MNKNAPPRLANWLLQHLLDEPHADALIGDLTELHTGGRSRGWYWRQAAIAIAASQIAGLRRHAIPLAAALVASWCVILLWAQVNAIFIHQSGDLYWWLRAILIEYQSPLESKNTARALVWGGGALLRVVCFAISGWIAVRVCQPKPIVAVTALTLTLVVWPLAWHQLRIFSEIQWLIHHGTAIAGVLIGAWVASRRGSDNRMWRIGTTA